MRRKIAIAVMAVCLICAGAVGIKMTTAASSANIKIEAQNQTVKKEQEVLVNVTVTSDVLIGKLDSIITYDDTVLEYVQTSEASQAGATGTIHISESYDSGTKTASYILKFRAIEVGQCTVAMDETVIETFDYSDVMEAVSESAVVTVVKNEAVSSDASLSQLLIAPVRMEEAFCPDIYEYHAEADADVVQLMISAVPSDDQAVVTVDVPETLVFGENKAVVTVTALSGDVSEYVIYVTRLETSSDDAGKTQEKETDLQPETENEQTVRSEDVIQTEEQAVQEDTEAFIEIEEMVPES